MFNISMLILSFWSFSALAGNDDIQIVTSDLSPYSIDVGMRPGFMVEIVLMIEDGLETGRTPQFYPWSRAQKLTQIRGNHLIFPLTRTPEREDLYDWLIDVAPIEYVFVTLDGRELTLKEAKKLERITVQHSTPFQQFLTRHNFTNLIATPSSSETPLRLLEGGRVQAWFTSKALAHYALEGKSFAQKAKMSHPIKTSRVFIASSKDFPSDVKRAYQRIFYELVEDGSIDYILKQYR